MNQWLNRCYIGDVRAVLGQMAADGVTVQMCVTSPPYWGLRDYGTAQWKGGSEACDHREDDRRNKRPLGKFHGGDDTSQTHPYRDTCGKCGARRLDQQIGLEQTPEEYVSTMVEVFRLVREVLAEDGTLWLNMGDSHVGGGRGGNPEDSAFHKQETNAGSLVAPTPVPSGLKPKDLVGIPWRVAFALQADGWYLRSDIVWHKPNPMPESVVDRPTKSHEYLFLMSKRERYFYDAEAIKEPSVTDDMRRPYGSEGAWQLDGRPKAQRPNGKPRIAHSRKELRSDIESRHRSAIAGGQTMQARPDGTRNRRSVWTIATEPFSEAHFATFPRKLVEPCILAGTSQRGHCPECGKRWVRVVRKSEGTIGRSWHDHAKDLQAGMMQVKHDLDEARDGDGKRYTVECLGWHPTCTCGLDAVPDIVLDPFLGSGTVAQVAQHLGRHWIGIDLNPHYTAMQTKRTAQHGLVLA